MLSVAMSAAEVVELLELAPHPEGGFYRETWRDASGEGGRGHGTAIYFLLPGGVSSAWHRVDAVEIWHWYAGAPLDLFVQDSESAPSLHHRLGPDLAAGQRPQAIVPASAWQSARGSDGGGWTLVGCTVSPAFEFSGFEIALPGFSAALKPT